MTHTARLDEKCESPSRNDSQLELTIYQIADDAMLKQNRGDGSGWEWCWADWQRDWMDATPGRFAYRCLPLTIANQTGLWITNPVGFTATWQGTRARVASTSSSINRPRSGRTGSRNEFGLGIITWNTPFLFRTKPEGSRLLVCGPANQFKANAHPLTAILESDWMTMSFTMNWKIMKPGDPVRFEVGEPLFQAIPLLSNACSDLEEASVTYKKMDDDPEVALAYREWDQSRIRFMERSKAGGVKPDEWQRDYFLGRDAFGTAGRPGSHDEGETTERPLRRNGGRDEPGRSHVRSRPAHRRHRASECPGAFQSSSGELPAPVHATAEVKPSGSASEQPGSQPVGRPVTDEWRRWIAENLMLGASRDSILNVMVRRRSRAVGVRIRDRPGLKSPYLRGAERLCNRLQKREWLLAAYRKLNRLHPDSGEIERRHRLSPRRVPRVLLLRQSPRHHHGHDGRLAGARGNGASNTSRAISAIAKLKCRSAAAASGNYEAERDKFRRKMLFSEFIEKVRTTGKSNDIYITASNNSANKAALPELWDDIVQIPEYLDGQSLQNGFFWFGPGRNDHTVPPRSDQQPHGAGDRPEADPASPVVGHAAHEKPLSRLLRDRRTCNAAGSRSEPRPAADLRVHPQPGRDPLLARRLLALRRSARDLGDRVFHQLRLRRQRLHELLPDLSRRLSVSSVALCCGTPSRRSCRTIAPSSSAPRLEREALCSPKPWSSLGSPASRGSILSRPTKTIWSRSAWASRRIPSTSKKFLAPGMTPNGVFGAKVHWHQFVHLTTKLRSDSRATAGPISSSCAAPSPT